MPDKIKNKTLTNLLLDFVINLDRFQEARMIYTQLDTFLRQAIGSRPLLIFSRSKNESTQNTNIKGHSRILFNRLSYKNDYDTKVIDKTIQELCQKEFIHQEWKGHHYTSTKDMPGIIFYCGDNENQFYFGVMETQENIEESFMKSLVELMASVSQGINKMNELDRLEGLIYIDDVTGLYNQRKLMKDIDVSISRHLDLKEEFSVLFIDIDHFKSVNDGHGHLVGTQLLCEVGRILRETLRETDLIYRYGGDEFVVLIPDISLSMAKIIGQRVLESIKSTSFHVDEKSISKGPNDFKLSVSIGVAAFPHDANNREDILKIADRMMYEAKKGGRGQVCFTSELLDKLALLKNA